MTFLASLDFARRLISEGRHAAAVTVLRQLLIANPLSSVGHTLLGDAHQYGGRVNLAIECYQRALSLDPLDATTHNNLGGALQHLGQLDAASGCYREALKLKPEFPEALNNLGGVLQLQGLLDESIHYYKHAIHLRDYYPDANSSLLMGLAIHPTITRDEYLREAKAFGSKMLRRARPYASWPASSEPSNKPARIGFVSGDLRANPVGYFLESVLSHIDPARVQLLAFTTNHMADELTARIRPFFAEWHCIANLNDAAAAKFIYNRGPQVLVDLAGHTAQNRLPVFAWRPAPIQVSWLGYFASTGVHGIEYLLADEISCPKGDDAYFSESLWRLRNTRLCFTPPENQTVTPLPALRNGYVTFGSFQRLTKLIDSVLDTWADILHKSPDARLRLQMIEMSRPEAREHLTHRFATRGIARERVDIHGPAARDEYLKSLSEVDLILDTFPFPGGTTTCEALWMGVPTLTLMGTTLLGRQGASLLRAAGLSSWIAHTLDEYVEKAVQTARDITGLANLRERIRNEVSVSPLFDAPRFARELESTFTEIIKVNRKRIDK